jgi:hypothetical protein
MSTRSVIARVGEHEGEFAGVYHHSDGYPTGLGAYLWNFLHGYFHGDLAAMLRVLIDEHPAGWSCIVGKDFSLKPGYTWQRAAKDGSDFGVYSRRPDYRRPQCFCHGDRHEEPYTFTHEDLKDNNAGLEWLWIFDEKENRMYVRDLSHGEELIVYLDKEEPIWPELECGQDYSRCSHYASFHGLAPKGCNLSTAAYLGNRPLDFRDAVAFIINGKRYASTGSGGNSDYLAGHTRNPYPPNCWVASVKAHNGHPKNVPVAKIQDGKYTPYPGVSWVYPPTKDNPNETVVTQEGA